ncbi:hypothetical protein BDW22DRAFT_1480957 [Trametopsis cervina]|nr:hypothetical protein BDW22DRAFT_1480957 [Trametopsis cervina]
MGRYRCPSVSYEEVGSAGQAASSSQGAAKGSSKGKQRAEPAPATPPPHSARKAKHRVKPAVLPKAAEETKIKDQKRIAQKKERVRSVLKQFHQKYIYVGNLTAEITELQLEEVFQIFGPVQSVVMRSARGYPRSFRPGTNATGKERLIENQVYASVEFKHAGAVFRAMEMNGREVNGKKIVVARDALDLPEFTQMVSGYTKSEPAEPRSRLEAALTAREPVSRTAAKHASSSKTSSSRLQGQSTNARIAYQFRSRANGGQQRPNTKSTKKR